MVEDADGPLSRRWLGLQWSAWMPLMAAHPLALAQLPSGPGLLRVRRVAGGDALQWAGWVEDGVRQTAERLSRQVHLPVPPFDDPDVPARALWEARRLEGAAYEVSGAVPGNGEQSNTEWIALLGRWRERGTV